MIDFDRAKQKPSEYFDRPIDVVTVKGLDRQQRVEILRQWEYDARLLDVATEENMDGLGSESGSASNSLQEIHEALHSLDGIPETNPAGSKLG